MNQTRMRLYAIRTLTRLVDQSVMQVGHSLGSVINVGVGQTRPQRSKSRRSIRRPHHRYSSSADTDFLLWTIAWRLHAGGSVRLDGEKTLDRRIKREIGALVGKRIVGVHWRDPLLQFTLMFGRGSFLKVDLKKSDMFDGNDWTLRSRFSYLFKTGTEGRFLVSVE